MGSKGQGRGKKVGTGLGGSMGQSVVDVERWGSGVRGEAGVAGWGSEAGKLGDGVASGERNSLEGRGQDLVS